MKHIYLLLLCCCILGAPLHAEQKAEPQKETVLEKTDYKKAKAWYKKLSKNVKNAIVALKKVKEHKHSAKVLKKLHQISKTMPGYSKDKVKNKDNAFDSSFYLEMSERLKKVLTEERKDIVREHKTELLRFYTLLKKEQIRLDKLISDDENTKENLVDYTTELSETTEHLAFEVSEILCICVGDDELEGDIVIEPEEGDFGSAADE